MFKFFKLFSSKLKSGNENNKGKSTTDFIDKSTKLEIGKKRWNADFQPLRRLVLWGFDDNDNPSFLFFYGLQEVTQSKMLCNEVEYKSCAIFKGEGGHLPSTKAVEFFDRDNMEDGLYYKFNHNNYYNRSKKDDFKVKDYFYISNSKNYLTVPYFTSVCHEDIVIKASNQRIIPKGFRPARDPNDILNLTGELVQYIDLVVEMISNQNIYIRKKLLSDLIAKNPPKELYYRLLTVGSTELISGLFLELAKKSNPILKEEAIKLLESEIDWAYGNYAKGVKRCAKIYSDSLEPDKRAKRIQWLRDSIKTMDLHLIYINGKQVPSEKVIEGATYRKYANQGKLIDYMYNYDYTSRKYTEAEAPIRYKVGPYCDGRKLKLIDFKSTIQEAEIYGLADIIGKLAYYIDAPRLTYYLKGSGKTKAYNYFQRYLRRMMDNYADKDEDKFIEVMRYLLTQYEENDYVCKFPGNFQYNMFIRRYLYHDFKEKTSGSWNVYHQYDIKDQLVKLKGRYEYRKEIWDRHIEDVAYIAANAKIDVVIKACYYILKDSSNMQKLIEHVNYDQLIKLSLSPYKPLSSMFKKVLKDMTDKLTTFDPDLMLALMSCKDEEINKAAMDYFNKKKGFFSPEVIADLLLSGNINRWEELFNKNLISFTEGEYVEFIRHLLKNAKFPTALECSLSTSITESLSNSAQKIQQVFIADRVSIVDEIIQTLLHKKIPDWIAVFLEGVIFSFSYENMEGLLKELEISSVLRSTSIRNKCTIAIMNSIKFSKIPNDSDFMNILDSGSSKMVKMLIEIVNRNKCQLNDRLSTLLIMFESSITILNRLAEEVFDSMKEDEQKKMHSLLIDSPIERAYILGIKKLNFIYKDIIPSDFIIQMLEHGSNKVKSYISDKIDKTITDLENGNEELFMYYLKTLLLLPNKNSKSKEKVYKVLPQFVQLNREKLAEVEKILINIGASNIIIDSERALVTLAKIRKDGELNAGWL